MPVQEDAKLDSKQLLWKTRRHLLVFLVSIGMAIHYFFRLNLNISMVAMTQNRYVYLDNGTRLNLGPEFQWDNVLQGYVLSAFFYGSILTPLPSGLIARKIGGKINFGLSVLCTAALTLVAPWVAEWSVYALIVLRAFIGFLEGGAAPGVYCLWANWIPPEERTRASSRMHAGTFLGAVSGSMCLGYLADAVGWRSTFWFSGVLGFVWSIFWWLYVCEKPDTDPNVSEVELKYIVTSLSKASDTRDNPVDVPWKLLFTNKMLWICGLCTFCELWGFNALMTFLPKYFKDVFDYDLSQSAILVALPYICLLVMIFVSGNVADRCVASKKASVTTFRKLFLITGSLAQAVFILGAAYWRSIVGVVFCLMLGISMSAWSMTSLYVLPLDLSPTFASVIYGLGSTIGSLAGLLGPIAAGYIVSTENHTAEEWQTFLLVSVAMYVLGAFIFGLFGTAKRLSFDEKSRQNNA